MLYWTMRESQKSVAFLPNYEKEFICVQPRSTTAKQDFVEYMNELHSCVVQNVNMVC